MKKPYLKPEIEMFIAQCNGHLLGESILSLPSDSTDWTEEALSGEGNLWDETPDVDSWD